MGPSGILRHAQDLGEEARLAEARAAELRNQVHKYESGQPSAASGKTPEHANIPRLKKQAAKATQKAKQQRKGAKSERSDIGERISPVKVGLPSLVMTPLSPSYNLLCACCTWGQC